MMKYIYAICLMLSFISSSYANQALDERVLNLINDPEQLKQGEATFQSICSTCHAKDLSGGAGFNLKDEQWIHGDKPSDIITNIKQGFNNAGMPGFNGVFNDEQLKQIAAYILSKREGFETLTYKIYPSDHKDRPKANQVFKGLEQKKPSKSGVAQDNLINFDLPEIKKYIIEYEGILHAPRDQTPYLFAMINREGAMEVAIDGEVVTPTAQIWMRHIWPLKPGKQHIRIRFATSKKSTKGAKILVANEALTTKLFGISLQGKQFLNQSTKAITAENEVVIVRKKIVDLPSYSIAVGLPEKINFAFNTRSCAIVGLWTGEMINVGPNIEARGEDGSVILGQWSFHQPHKIGAASKENCKFEKYNVNGNPTFTYQQQGATYALTSKVNATNTITFMYQVLTPSNQANLTIQLPAVPKINYTSKQGTITDNHWVINTHKNKQFELTVNIEE